MSDLRAGQGRRVRREVRTQQSREDWSLDQGLLLAALLQPTRTPQGETLQSQSETQNSTVYLVVALQVEKIVVDALANLDGEFAGKYYPLDKMTEAEQQQLIDVSRSTAHVKDCM